ncbi:MAG: hypothetical protein ACIAQ0_09215 [Phycisphaerales bacterium JB058]
MTHQRTTHLKPILGGTLLSRLRAQSGDRDPIVHAKYIQPWEGGRVYYLFELHTDPDTRECLTALDPSTPCGYAVLPLRWLEESRGPMGERPHLDPGFTPIRREALIDELDWRCPPEICQECWRAWGD